MTNKGLDSKIVFTFLITKFHSFCNYSQNLIANLLKLQSCQLLIDKNKISLFNHLNSIQCNSSTPQVNKLNGHSIAIQYHNILRLYRILQLDRVFTHFQLHPSTIFIEHFSFQLFSIKPNANSLSKRVILRLKYFVTEAAKATKKNVTERKDRFLFRAKNFLNNFSGRGAQHEALAGVAMV